jgi:transcriptional regulator with AAA-type ATPase domain
MLRLAALRCRAALLWTNGDRERAAAAVGLSRAQMWRYLKWDNDRLDRERLCDLPLWRKSV